MREYRISPLARAALASWLIAWPGAAPAQAPADAAVPSPLTRRYVEGDAVVFTLRATNHGRERVTKYAAKARSLVRRDETGASFEEVAWLELAVDDKPVELPAASLAFRQRLSLTRNAPLQIPDVSGLHPALITPVLDLLNFYGDLSLTARMTDLRAEGDHLYLPHNRAHSWADGRVILVGENAVDFDLTLTDFKAGARTATLMVRHVPPPEPAIKIEAEWMRNPVAGGANNWTQVRRAPDGKYLAAAGRETINVTIVLDAGDGRPISATLDNAVEVTERECRDFALSRCGEPVRYRVFRAVELLSGPVSRADQ